MYSERIAKPSSDIGKSGHEFPSDAEYSTSGGASLCLRPVVDAGQSGVVVVVV